MERPWFCKQKGIEFTWKMLDKISVRIGHLRRALPVWVATIAAVFLLAFAIVYELRLPERTPGRFTSVITGTAYFPTQLKDGRILFIPSPNYTQGIYECQPWLTLIWAWWYGHVMPRPEEAVDPPEMVTPVAFDPVTRKFSYTSAMEEPGAFLVPVVLRDGRVFLNGTRSWGPNDPERAPEIYDPVSGKFHVVPPIQGVRLSGRQPFVLNNGKVLLAGGEDPVLLWDPESNRIKTLRGPCKDWSPRIVVTLDSGKVLLIGNECVVNRELPTLELYDPASERFSFAGSLPENWDPFSAIKLRNGRVLIIGGEGSLSEHFNAYTLPTRGREQIYDPRSGRLEPTPFMMTYRYRPLVTLLKDGTVLFVEGYGFPKGLPNWRLFQLSSAEIYKPEDNAFEAVGSLPKAITDYTGRFNESLTLLLDGRVLYTASNTDCAVALYDPFSRTFNEMCATRLANEFKFQLDPKSVLLVGSPTAETAEIFNPQNGESQTFPIGLSEPTHWLLRIRRFVTGYPGYQIKRDQFLK